MTPTEDRERPGRSLTAEIECPPASYDAQADAVWHAVITDLIARGKRLRQEAAETVRQKDDAEESLSNAPSSD